VTVTWLYRNKPQAQAAGQWRAWQSPPPDFHRGRPLLLFRQCCAICAGWFTRSTAYHCTQPL